MERMRIKGGALTEPETIENEENVLNILFSESDADGNVIEGGIEKENSAILKYFTPGVQAELKGKAKDSSIVTQLAKAFEGDKLETIMLDLGLEKDDKAAADKFFKLTIVKIGLVEKRALDETFFNEVFPGAAIATEAEQQAKVKRGD